MSDSDIIDGCLSIRDGRLYIEDVDTTALAQEFGTPLFVISEAQIRNNFREVQQAFAEHWPEGPVRVLPALKAAPYLAVRRILSEEGAGCDTFGASELEAAVRGGTPAEHISVNGSVKTAEVIQRAVELGARIVLDAPRELDLVVTAARQQGTRARVMLRLKPYLEGLDTDSDLHPGSIRELTQRVRYGMPTNEAQALGERLKVAGQQVELIGFHCHIGRHSTRMEVWETLVDSFVDLAAELLAAWQLPISNPVFDFGGGFAATRNYDTDHVRTGEPAPAMREYAAAMTNRFRRALVRNALPVRGTGLEVEPGRRMHSDTGLHLARVVNLKHSGLIERTWAETDTSEFFVGTWSMDTSQPPFRFRVANRADAAAVQTLDIVGKSCGGEMILPEVPVPEIAVGDVLALLDTGGYIESLGCNFNAMPRPGTVLVSGAQAEWIRRPETVDQVFQRDLIPERLGDAPARQPAGPATT